MYLPSPSPRRDIRHWLLLVLMCLLPWQSLYATAMPLHVPTEATSVVGEQLADAAQADDCHESGKAASKTTAQCDDAHCAACVPPIVHPQAMTPPAIAPILVATAPPPPLDTLIDPALKPPRY
ncbi:hypothetical protein JHS3_03310 [Jeongeupia sp. HS-3]|uniref:hypothetical protein n=1 Tax=Jeongeupia sp. HS-3 TaxID=1009682 RepID=UPI0018A53094|nr:hypothetical protein [Jeongeupia sp. HS-3]BCL74595.1 hypothetical protein JHS3_03310 [Jeongeupia sp. HS-3]